MADEAVAKAFAEALEAPPGQAYWYLWDRAGTLRDRWADDYYCTNSRWAKAQNEIEEWGFALELSL